MVRRWDWRLFSRRQYGATIIVGAQHGDESKGKISIFVAEREDAELVGRAGVGPNAEHGIFINGKYVKVNQLPLGFFFLKNPMIVIGPGTCVDPRKLFAEIEMFGLQGKVWVDPRCPIVLPEHLDWERKNLPNNSTYSGCGPCRSEFVLRKALQARDIPELAGMLIDVQEEVNRRVDFENVIIESSQGTLLSLAISYDYPAVTSDNVTAAAAMDDVGLNWQKVKSVILCVKTMPTRESHGPMTSDELTLEEMQARNLIEISSIDGGIRRKSRGIDFKKLVYATQVNGATEIALTFCDHWDPAVTNITDQALITPKIWELVDKIEDLTEVPVTILETGKDCRSVIDIRTRLR